MSFRPHRAGALAAGLLTAVALIALGQPANASTGRAGGPASVDAAQPRVAKDADEARHRVPNPLLKEVLSEEGEGESTDDPALSALCQDFVDQAQPVPEPGAERRPDRRRHDRDGRQPGRLQQRRRTRPRSRSTR